MKRPNRRCDGWILLEVVTGLVVATLLTGAFAEVWTAGMRGSARATARMTEERHRTLAVHTALHKARQGAPAAMIEAELNKRFPELEISVSGTVLTIAGEDLPLEVLR